jgi:hypothetical protein
VRTLRKKRSEGDPTKLEEFQRAAMDLAQAHRFFCQLKDLGEAVAAISSSRLDTHIAFCADTHTRAAQHLELVSRWRTRALTRRHPGPSFQHASCACNTRGGVATMGFRFPNCIGFVSWSKFRPPPPFIFPG